MKNKLKGFSLVELLVAMAIIAVLLGLVGFGIATAQRSARDNQRQQKLSDMQLALEDFQIRKNRYPTSDEFNLGQSQLVLTVGGGNDIEIQLDGPTTGKSEGTDGSTPTGAVYCYSPRPDAGGYLLGVLLENGEWFDKSSTLSGTESCTTPLTPTGGASL